MHVTIVGAGLVGLSTAYFLHRNGYHVCLIEQHENSAQETSFANGGQLSAFYCQPFASPRFFCHCQKAQSQTDAPFYCPPNRAFATPAWLAGLHHASQPIQHNHHAIDLFQLACANHIILDTVLRDLPAAASSKKNGVLSLYRTKESFQQGEIFAALLAEYGLSYQSCSPLDCQTYIGDKFYTKKLYAGLYLPQDCSADAYQYAQALTQYLIKQGVHIKWSTRVDHLITQRERVTGLQCYDSEKSYVHPVDQLVLCTAARTRHFLPGLSSFLYGIGGYSLSIAQKKESYTQLSLIDQEEKIVITPLKQILRIAGLCDLLHINHDQIWLKYRRQQRLLKSLSEWFPDDHLNPSDVGPLWQGERPLVTDSIPLVGQVDYDNLYLNIGHGFWGWTTCCITGKLLSMIIEEQQTRSTCSADIQRFLPSLKHRWRPLLHTLLSHPNKFT